MIRVSKLYPLTCKYPQGAEKQLINACTGREVPSRASCRQTPAARYST